MIYPKLFLFTLFLTVLLSCRSAGIKPVELAAEDMCSHCKMAISEKEFAAEFINHDGDAFKFDDIGCMLDYLKEKPDTKIAAYFFVDYETKQWVKSTEASFVKSAEITAPMGGGMIAFHDQAKADAAAAKYKGKKLNFEELTRQ
ncbi:MAG: nitrous oxide reductase accessory protein NosL [Acidobacteria bacterium]|nr:nitrous oxide reductase accessory protein NosL [Acidobacteriota bacterium]